jgi:hypothetical protein
MDAFGTLEPADTDEDFYKFSAQQGDLIFIDTAAKPDADPFSDAYPDLVITLYDGSENQVAQNDDPYLVRDTNDSQLWYYVPATGDYYVRVSDCLKEFGSESCAGPETIVNHDYGLRVSLIDPADDGVVEDGEAGDTENEANTMEFVENTDTATAGDYYASINFGTFNDDTDVDVYSFAMPGGAIAEERLFGAIFIQGPEGIDGMGTTNNIGDAWITEADGTTIISQIDHTLGIGAESRELRAPMTAGMQYYLWVAHPGGGAGSNDFYIFNSNATDSNPQEAGEPNNDLGTEETVATMANGELQSGFIGGILDSGVGDTADRFQIAVPGGLMAGSTLSVACGAIRSGSGLILGVTVQDDADDSDLAALTTESEDEDLVLTDVDITGVTAVNVILTPESSQANVTSRFYQCGFHFVPPAM